MKIELTLYMNEIAAGSGENTKKATLGGLQKNRCNEKQ
jgi:hypothetical protein